MSELESKLAKREHPVARVLGWLITAAVLLTLGWLAHSLMPTPEPVDIAAMMAAEQAKAGAPQVVTQKPTMKTLRAADEYIGHVEAIQDVGLRAQIDGYVHAVHFVEGAFVKAGDLLFTIDPERYEARVALRKAEIGQAEAALERADLYLKRLEASDARAIVQSNLDTARSDVAQGKAAIKQAVANLALAEIDLKHTKIFAPVSGKIGRTVANVGDYVAPALGTLVRIVQFDPVRVVFSVSDRDYVRFVGSFDNGAADTLRVRLRMPTGEVAAMQGQYDFANNEMSLDTATIPIRARFDNATNLLVPGGYVTVLIDSVNAPRYPVVRQSALTSDKDGYFIYTVDEKSTAQVQRVQIGASANGYVEITEGLKGDEVVIMEGVIKVQPGRQIEVQRVEKQAVESTQSAATAAERG